MFVALLFISKVYDLAICIAVIYKIARLLTVK